MQPLLSMFYVNLSVTIVVMMMMMINIQWPNCLFVQKQSDEKSPIGPYLLAFFIFVVCGSGKPMIV